MIYSNQQDILQHIVAHHEISSTPLIILSEILVRISKIDEYKIVIGYIKLTKFILPTN